MHWRWIKDGSILRVAGGGYILLNVINGIIKNTLLFPNTGLIVAASVFLVGEILHYTYTPILKLGKKHYLQSINIAR